MFNRSLLLVSLFVASNALAGDRIAEDAQTVQVEETTDTEGTDSDRGWWCPTHVAYDQCPLDELTEEELSAQEQADEALMAADLDEADALERTWWCPIHSAYDNHPIIDAQGW